MSLLPNPILEGVGDSLLTAADRYAYTVGVPHMYKIVGREGVNVGNPGPELELPWGLVSIGVALVPMSRIWRGPVATALGGLQCRYQ